MIEGMENENADLWKSKARVEALEAENAKLRAVLKKCAEFFAGTDNELEAEIATALASPKP